MFSDAWPEGGRARHALTELVAGLREVPDFSTGSTQVERALRSCRVDAVLSSPLRLIRGRYTRTLLYREERFELLLLAWGSGSGSPIHDHAGQRCWLLPIAGRFALDDFALRAGGKEPGHAHVERTGARVLRQAELDHREGEAELHRVAVPAGCDGAVSLHVYAKPIVSCLVFDEARQRCRRRWLAYDAVASLGDDVGEVPAPR